MNTRVTYVVYFLILLASKIIDKKILDINWIEKISKYQFKSDLLVCICIREYSNPYSYPVKIDIWLTDIQNLSVFALFPPLPHAPNIEASGGWNL